MTPRRIFVDSGAWFAALVIDDAHHEDGASALSGLIALPIALVTTNHVVDETYTLLRVTCAGLLPEKKGTGVLPEYFES